MDVVDPLAPLAQTLHGLGAACQEVARVQQEADVRQLEQALDLGRRLGRASPCGGGTTRSPQGA
jgi:hypothetical protein